MRHLIAATLLLASAPAALNAQNSEADRRVDRLEREVRALQREVFPGGSGEFFEPEIRPGTSGSQSAGNPASAPITDLIDRVNSLERQLATLTGQVEENNHRLRQIEATLEGLQAAEAEEEAAPDGEDDDIPGFDDQAEETPSPPSGEAGEAVSGNLRAMAAQEQEGEGDTPGPAAETEDVPAGEGPFRAEGAEPPLPDDPGEASYVRGYRLWRDGDYEAARTQLRETVEDFPGHRFESYARNLLGRAYLDDDKPASATEIFVRNYQQLPNGERAADSLFFLGVALTRLNYQDRACLAFAELEEVYGGTIRSDIAEQLPAARQAAECN